MTHGTRKRLSTVLALISVSGSMAAAAPPIPEKLQVPERGFISSQPAKTWQQGLISGNGTIGANVLSRPLDETIIFTHERLFLPKGPPVMPPLIAPRLFEVRRLIDRGLYQQATELAFDLSEQEGFIYPDPFVPAFDLSIKMDTEDNISDYMRSVDFQTGEAAVHWADGRGVYERRLFVSRKHGVAVLQITGPEEGVSCRLRLKTREPSPRLDKRKLEASSRVFQKNITDIAVTAEHSALTFRNSFAQAYPGSIHALEGVARVFVTKGSASPEGETLVIKDADRVLLLIYIRMIYDPDRSLIQDMKTHLAALQPDYDALLRDHARIHGELFNRVKLDIGGGPDHALTTEELLAKTSNEKLSKALIEKEFDAGRYNIISCTGELPPVLQGVWAGTYSPSWASDFTHNGNVPSAIASMLMGNTPELMLAYTGYMESIVPYMELNARRIFGARGIILPSRSTTNGFNNSFAPRFAGAFWVAGAAWAAHFFYDYYLYTGDRAFLEDHALPFMEKAAVFYEDYLYEGPDGKYIFSPTQSPENTPGNSNSQGSFNATMDVDAAKELLRNLIAVSRELRVNHEQIPKWQSMLGKMPEYQVNEDGAIKEWLTPKLEDQHKHRHSSHLYALYDGIPDEIARNPKLQEAFKRVIEIKLDRHWKGNASGFMSFGVVQLGQAATSLKDAELAYECLKSLVNRYWLHNLASMHNHKTLFNMDISGGMPAVIIKMLMASEPGSIELLPALPKAWPDGKVTGLLARGGFEVDITWKDGKLAEAVLRSKIGSPCRLVYQDRSVELTTEAGRHYRFEGNLNAKGEGGAESNQPAPEGRWLEEKTCDRVR
jgi:alpha-L-fucosidase 2